jgi:co-chaperonin GroES (HSP10)
MKLLGNRILIAPVAAPAVVNGIFLAPRHHPPSTGHVFAVGSKVEWPELREGQLVAIRPMEGEPFELGDRKLLLYEPKSVLGMLVEA